jgi:phenylacetate-CoA ligase
MNYRKSIGFLYLKARGDKFPAIYNKIKASIDLGDFENVGNKCLSEILKYCKKNVPYYRNILDSVDDIELGKGDPIDIIKKIPPMTKDIIRRHFQDLQTKDLYERKWYYNTSGGSTGEPIRLIQDREYQEIATAITHLYYWLIGHEIGKAMVKLWGSERDILEGSVGIRAKATNYFWNIHLMNAFRMTPEKMKQYLSLLESNPPDLVLAYAQSIYELALFAERNGIRVAPQRAIMTSAGTLYPFMREKIEGFFRCKLFNQYGSRVGCAVGVPC